MSIASMKLKAECLRRNRKASRPEVVVLELKKYSSPLNLPELLSSPSESLAPLSGLPLSFLTKTMMFSDGNLDERISTASDATNPNPSQSQSESGNYKKGKFSIDGITIAIENPAGSTRRGIGSDGTAWSAHMPFAYGYIARSVSEADGDAVDVFLGNFRTSRKVFVINQFVNGVFDEHKCVLFANTKEEAANIYLSSYCKGWNGLQSIVEMGWAEFVEWAFRGDSSIPVPLSAEFMTFDMPDLLSVEISKQYEYEGNLYVYGPVLVPDSVDRQGDIVSADDIRKCVRKFMDYQQAGERHQSMIPRSGVKLTQNFIAPVDFVESGKKISKGSWVVEFSVIDPILRQKIMSGEYRSFSIGGKAKSSPVN